MNRWRYLCGGLLWALSALAQAHFTHFEPRVIHIVEEAGRVDLFIRMPLPLLLLDGNWKGVDAPGEVAFARRLSDADGSDYRFDRSEFQRRYPAFEERIRSGYRVTRQGISVKYRILGVHVFDSDRRRSFASIAAARAVFNPQQPVAPEVGSIFDSGLDLHLAFDADDEGAEFILSSALGERFKAIERLANIVHLHRDGEVDRTTTIGVLDYRADRVQGGFGSWLQKITRGIVHILIGWDHLLLIVLIAFVASGPRRLLLLASAFTVGHSISLLLGTRYLFSSPLFIPLIELLIALSIALVAVGLIRGRHYFSGGVSLLLIGIIHGFGFSFVFNELYADAGGPGLVSLGLFSVGIELGQIGTYLLVLLLTRALEGFNRRCQPAYYVAGVSLLVSGYWVMTRSWDLVGQLT